MTDAAQNDEVLMERYARGEVSAFETLYRRHELRVWRYLERNVNNRAAADDLMQEVWFAVARDAPKYRPSARFTTWLFTIAHHRMIDWMRANRRLVSLETLDHDAPAVAARLTADGGASPLAAAVAGDQAAAIVRALAGLPHEQRDAFLMHVEGDLGVKEIASIAGVSFETAKSRLRYARAKLRELLEEHV